jgi:PAS domain S-box-containing protein
VVPVNDPVHALFVTSDQGHCADAVEQLEAAGEGDLLVAGATSVEAVRETLAETPIDCVVFGEDEDPLSPDGVQLLDVVDLCTAPPGEAGSRTIPLVLFSDGTYPLSTAKATDGVTDYARADSEDAFEHLANRLRWISSNAGDDAAYYKRIVEEMEDGVLTFDDGGRIRYANGAMADTFGLRQDAFEGTDPAELAEWGLVPAEGVEALESAVSAIVDGGVDLRAREVTITPSVEDVDRRVVEFQVVGMPGEASGALATVRGVTEYKRIENALRTTSTKVERLPDGVAAIRSSADEDELYETTAAVVSQFLSADVCGVDDVQDGQFVPRATAGVEYGPSSATEGEDARAVREGESVLVESPGPEDAPVDNAGSQLCVPVEGLGLVRAAATGRISDRDRGLAETLGAVAAETLSRIRAEDARDEVRERLRSLYENLPDPVASYVLRDGDPVVVAANSAFEDAFGVSGDPAGTPLEAFVAPPEGEFGAALRSNAHDRLPLGRDDGREYEVHVGPSAADGEDGYLVYRDVTDRRESEALRRGQADRLDRIHGIVTEDLRDQLNEARGYLELATETRDPDDMAAVDDAHERIEGLIEDASTLAGQDPEMTPEELDLRSVAAKAWHRVDANGADLGVREGSVVADSARLSGLFEQLFRNSLDQATTNGEDPSLTVQVGPLESGFYVEDTATSVPESLRDRRLEDVDEAVEEAQSRLAAIQQVAEAHDWSVRIAENEYGGTRFEFVAD